MFTPRQLPHKYRQDLSCDGKRVELSIESPPSSSSPECFRGQPAFRLVGGCGVCQSPSPAPVIQFRIKITFISHYSQTTDWGNGYEWGTRWDLGHYCGNGAQHLRVTDGRGFEWHFTRQEFSFLITRNIIICVMTPRPVSPPQHTKTIIASWIYQEGKIYFVTWRSTHPRHVAAGNGTWDDVIMEIHMKRKDSFALRFCVMKENVIYYKSKLVDKRTEVPLNWRSIPVQELPEFTSLTPLP